MRSSFVLRRHACPLRSRRKTQIKIKTKTHSHSGFIHPIFVVGGALLCAGLAYLFTINASAMQGQVMRDTERHITQLRREHEQLRITEAQLLSLYNIEDAGERLKMTIVHEAVFLEEPGPIALK